MTLQARHIPLEGSMGSGHSRVLHLGRPESESCHFHLPAGDLQQVLSPPRASVSSPAKEGQLSSPHGATGRAKETMCVRLRAASGTWRCHYAYSLFLSLFSVILPGHWAALSPSLQKSQRIHYISTSRGGTRPRSPVPQPGPRCYVPRCPPGPRLV